MGEKIDVQYLIEVLRYMGEQQTPPCQLQASDALELLAAECRAARAFQLFGDEAPQRAHELIEARKAVDARLTLP